MNNDPIICLEKPLFTSPTDEWPYWKVRINWNSNRILQWVLHLQW